MRRLDGRKLDRFRRLLQDMQWMLTREYWKDRMGSREQIKENPEDIIDLAVRSYTRDFLLSLGEMERKQLFMIEDALARIDRDEYGTCSHCGASIPESRLEAAPWARLCIVCQGLQEDGLLPQWIFSPSRRKASRIPSLPRSA